MLEKTYGGLLFTLYALRAEASDGPHFTLYILHLTLYTLGAYTSDGPRFTLYALHVTCLRPVQLVG